MAGIAGVVYKKNKINSLNEIKISGIEEKVNGMLDAIIHRGKKYRRFLNFSNRNISGIVGLITNFEPKTDSSNLTLNSNSENAIKIQDQSNENKAIAGYGNANKNGEENQKGNEKGHLNSCLILDGKIYNINRVYSKYGNCKNPGLTEKQKLQELINDFDINILKNLNGPFAAFYNDSKHIYLFRDFLGRKPLYYSYDDDGNMLFFASEVKSLSGIGLAEIIELLPGYFIKDFCQPELFRKLETNKYIKVSIEDCKKRAAKSPDEKNIRNLNKEKKAAAEDIFADKIDQMLLGSIEKRIPAGKGLKIGAWLSGGLDSSIIAAMLKVFIPDVYTFAVGFKGSKDLNAARKVAKYLGTIHKEYILDEQLLLKSVPKTIYLLESFDAPLVRSTLGNVIAAKMSAEVDIVFSGEGGDELFAGYNYFLKYNSEDKIQTELFKAINSLHNTALQRVDRASNSQGTIVKTPMLDEDLVDFVLKIPPRYKIDYKTKLTKYILRKVAEKYLPYDIVWRPKDKFWEGSGINNILEDKIDDIITDTEFEDNKKITEDFTARNKEEFYYYKIFKNFYPGVDFSNFLSFTSSF